MRVFFVALLGALLMASTGRPQAEKRHAKTQEATITIPYNAGHPLRTFVPYEAFGAGVDGLEKGDIARVYTPENLKKMLSAGFKPLSYRLRTELAVEAWHWNPRGKWSDPGRQQGYWISDDQTDKSIDICYGYRLPHRGSGLDQANEDSYSRLADGDWNTYWKSNPYLDRHFTGEDNALHPQWALIDLEAERAVNAMRIRWAIPYAVAYQVQYWVGTHAYYLDDELPNEWRTFAGGTVQAGRGGDVTLRLSKAPRKVRFVRIFMTRSSEAAPMGSQDIRDGLGYAIRELYLGTLAPSGKFHDCIAHGTNLAHQTPIFVSSTDPWHHATDRDRVLEQPGFDRVFHSGLTNGMPVMIPVPILYDTPDNAAAEIRYLRARGYPVQRIEMGEEPDGQYILPEDYGALYIQWADAIHKIDPSLELGGPCFQSTILDVLAWPDRYGNRSWLNRFLGYLEKRHHLKDFQFFSLEWYPFDNLCEPVAPQLTANTRLMDGVFHRLQKDGLSRSIPWFLTEYGYSSFEGQPEVEITGALLNADSVGRFLILGGKTAYYYGYEPNTLLKNKDCPTWGNLALLLANEKKHTVSPLASYYGAWLLTQQWTLPSDRPHQLYQATSDARNARGQELVTAYALLRPDRKWSFLLINKDPHHAWNVRFRFQDSAGRALAGLTGPKDLYQYSSAQYVWHAHGEKGYAQPNNPPQHTTPGENEPIRLPPYSLSVLRSLGP